MNGFLAAALSNALVATLLFLGILLGKRWIGNPAVLHLLWLVVMLKLITPPVISLPLAWLPAERADGPLDRETTQRVTTLESEPGPIMLSESPDARRSIVESLRDAAPAVSPSRFNMSASSWLFTAWLVGSSCWLTLASWRIVRFTRWLKCASSPAPQQQAIVDCLASTFNLRRAPQVLLVEASISPMLWSLGARAQILLPRQLVAELDEASQETLLLHELAHYARRDHWVRMLEIIVLAAYWWLPIAWWLRREARAAEEQACDAWVVAQRPEHRRAYAAMLVQTIGFLSSARLPAAATGVASGARVEQRLVSILQRSVPCRAPRWAKALVVGSALAVLVLGPALVQRPAVMLAAQEPGVEKPATAKPGEETSTLAIVSPTGEPIADAKVDVYLSGEQSETRSANAQGELLIPRRWQTDRTGSVQLVARQPGKLGWWTPWLATVEAPKRLVLLPLERHVIGTLVDGEGRPLAGVKVLIDSMSHPTSGGFDGHSLRQPILAGAVTDKAGNFALDVPSGTKVTLLPLHPAWQRRSISVAAPMNDLGQITLVPAGRIVGRVLASGKPVADAPLLAQSVNRSMRPAGFVGVGFTRTDAEGRYEIGGLSPGSFNVLFGKQPKTADETVLVADAAEGVDVQSDLPAEVNFSATAGRALRGKVIEAATRRPLAGVSVGYYGPARPQSGASCFMTKTAEDGTFRFVVPSGQSYVYVADGNRDQLPDSTRTVQVPADRDVDVTLLAGPKQETEGFSVAETDGPRRYELPVRLVPPAGMKVGKVEVRLGIVGSTQFIQLSGGAGTTLQVPLFKSTAGRRAFLMIDSPGFAPTRSPEFVVHEAMDQLTVQLEAATIVPLSGRVIDAQGRPLAEARVRVIRRLLFAEELFPWGLEYATDSDGRFEVKHARVGDCVRIRIDSPGTSGALSEWFDITSPEAITLGEMRLGPALEKLGGTLLDYQGNPVAGAKVSHADGDEEVAITDDKGAFLLTKMPVGKLKLMIDSQGFPVEFYDAMAGRLDNQIRVNRLTLADHQALQVAIKIETADGGALEKAESYFGVADGKLLSSSWGGEIRRTRDFAMFHRAHAGHDFAMIVQAKGYELSAPVTIKNQRNPPPVTIKLVPAKGTSLRGRVVDADNKPVAGAMVGLSLSVFKAAWEPWNYFDTHEKVPLTDANGEFVFSDLCAGSEVAVYFNKAGYGGVWSKRIKLKAGEAIDLGELSLPASRGDIRGRVVDVDGKPVAGTAVQLLDITQPRTITDADGRFLLKQMPAGERILRTPYDSTSHKVTAPAEVEIVVNDGGYR